MANKKMTAAMFRAINSKRKIQAKGLKAKALKAERGKGKQIDDPRYKEL